MRIINMLLFLLIAISCSNKNEKLLVIDLQAYPIVDAYLSEIADTVMSIPLETKNNCLLLNNLCIQRDDSLLFIENYGEMYLFNTYGKFIRQLTRKGNGVGETWVYGFDLNREKRELIVNGRGRKILRYGYDGALISEAIQTQPYFHFRPFAFYRDLIWTVASTPFPDNSSWVLTLDINYKIKDSIKLFTPQMPREMYSEYSYSSFSVVDNIPYINHPSIYTDHIVRDTLYKIENGKTEPILRVNFGNHKYRTNENPIKSGYALDPFPIRITKRFLITGYRIDNEINNNFNSYNFYYDLVLNKAYHIKKRIQ